MTTIRSTGSERTLSIDGFFSELLESRLIVSIDHPNDGTRVIYVDRDALVAAVAKEVGATLVPGEIPELRRINDNEFAVEGSSQRVGMGTWNTPERARERALMWLGVAAELENEAEQQSEQVAKIKDLIDSELPVSYSANLAEHLARRLVARGVTV